jgi:hypothetical protein
VPTVQVGGSTAHELGLSAGDRLLDLGTVRIGDEVEIEDFVPRQTPEGPTARCGWPVHRRVPAGLGWGRHPGVPPHRVRGPAGERPPGLGDRGRGRRVASCGVYQLTPLKSRCLKHCRSPLSLLLHDGA